MDDHASEFLGSRQSICEHFRITMRIENNPAKPDESHDRQETNEGEKPERKTDGSYRISAGYVLSVRQSFLFSPICQSASLLPPGWLALSAGQLPKQDYPEASEVAFVSAAGANT